MKLDTCSLILFSILVLFSCLHTNIYAQVLEQDSLALVALYNSTNGGSWNHNTNWLAGPVEEWYGVIVSEGRVIEISMDHNNIEGVIPPEIGDLTALTAFRLYFNKLTSPLPIEMGNMTSLTILNLGNNQIGDTIPSIIASNLKNLEALALDNNNFTGSIPPELYSLTN